MNAYVTVGETNNRERTAAEVSKLLLVICSYADNESAKLARRKVSKVVL